MKQTLHCCIADTAFTREQVYRLRYACYLRRASIDARPDERFTDHFDDLPNHFSFLVRNDDGEPQATLRLSVVRPDLGWNESPGSAVFQDHPALIAMAAGGFVEASRLCFAPQARRDALMKLLGYMAAMAEFYEAEWLMACPRMEHSPMYQRQFGFRPLAEPRTYHGVKFETQLLGVRRHELQEHVRDVRPMRNAWCDALAHLENQSANLRG